MSSTSTTRRSRSGCQVRTTTLLVRADARQSMERTSSPRTYSRSESNSVPCPRTRTAERPSSSRSRASREGRCLRDSNGGSDRTAPGTSIRALLRRQPERPARAHREPDGAQVAAPPRLQRRTKGARSPGESRTRCRLPEAPAEGCQASRSSARTRRREVLVATTRVSVGCPSRTEPTGRRSNDSERRRRGEQPVGEDEEQHQQAATATIVLMTGRSTTGTRPRTRSSGTRPEIAIS